MKGNASVTIIRSKGNAAQAVVDGVVNKEIERREIEHQRKLKRLKEQHAREIAKLKTEIEFLNWALNDITEHRNKLLMQKIGRYRNGISPKRNIITRLMCSIKL